MWPYFAQSLRGVLAGVRDVHPSTSMSVVLRAREPQVSWCEWAVLGGRWLRFGIRNTKYSLSSSACRPSIFRAGIPALPGVLVPCAPPASLIPACEWRVPIHFPGLSPSRTSSLLEVSGGAGLPVAGGDWPWQLGKPNSSCLCSLAPHSDLDKRAACGYPKKVVPYQVASHKHPVHSEFLTYSTILYAFIGLPRLCTVSHHLHSTEFLYSLLQFWTVLLVNTQF